LKFFIDLVSGALTSVPVLTYDLGLCLKLKVHTQVISQVTEVELINHVTASNSITH